MKSSSRTIFHVCYKLRIWIHRPSCNTIARDETLEEIARVCNSTRYVENPKTTSVFWANILERDGWLLVTVDDRKLGIIISVTEAGQQHLRVAGFNLGESMFVGERLNVLSVKVERVQESNHKEMLPKIHEALPPELRGMPVTFL